MEQSHVGSRCRLASGCRRESGAISDCRARMAVYALRCSRELHVCKPLPFPLDGLLAIMGERIPRYLSGSDSCEEATWQPSDVLHGGSIMMGPQQASSPYLVAMLCSQCCTYSLEST